MLAVSTKCPFCGTAAKVLNDDDDAMTADAIAERVVGQEVACKNAACLRTFPVRRSDLKIRRGPRRPPT